jgi:uncharacterized OB-fold protein
MAEYNKPLPKPDPVTKPYWDSVKAHAMQIQKCNDTDQYFFYPRGISPFTGSTNISWEEVSGRGEIYAFTILPTQRSAWPGFEAPYVVAMVELEEGPKLMTNIVNVEADPEHISVGMPVKVFYDDVTDEITLPKFEPA